MINNCVSHHVGGVPRWAAVAIIAGAGVLFSAVASDAKAQDVTTQAPTDGYERTAIIGVEAGQSFIRFANMGDDTTTNHVEVYGLDSKSTLASFTIDVPAKASIQFQPELMVQTFAPVDYDQQLVVYVENGHTKQLWQHVKYDGRNNILTDLNACVFAPHLDYSPKGNVVINAHTGALLTHFSFVTVHNFTDKAGVFEARVYDAATGQHMGSVDVELGPRESFSENAQWYQTGAGWFIPRQDQPHMNIEFVQKGADSGARLVVAHEVLDLTTGVSTNLSNPCPIHGGIITLPQPGEPQ